MILYPTNFQGTIPRLKLVNVMSLKVGEAVMIDGVRYTFLRRNTDVKEGGVAVEILVSRRDQPLCERWYVGTTEGRVMKITGYHLRQRKAT
ncbi:hypothetical protein HWC07_gp072 [Pantoea phage vB_PagM_LIET2]|uniref:Uncharacterized protein n=1 Tax=Pantoea phage vB_PagM_LIET2 TaxID=2508071 RepID=A0A411AW46_9CAUD|nr:hypothetical protein HWC07_gp072 [Pantoea phage vB_PagM_LIET2]QAX92324.1 hypothetical protein LIET2_gp072 [Pantoea phage vB_PagM_LIET2]